MPGAGRSGTKRKFTTAKATKKVADRAAVRSLAREEAKKIVNSRSELKYYDEGYLPNCDFDGQIHQCCDIAPGNTSTTREGDVVSPVSLHFSYLINGETNSGLVRFMVFRWNQYGVPTPADILKTTGSAYSPVSNTLWDTRSNFTILYDKLHQVSNNGGPELVGVSRTIKLAKKPLKFKSGSSTGPKNGIYILTISESASIGSPSSAMEIRLTFRDM